MRPFCHRKPVQRIQLHEIMPHMAVMFETTSACQQWTHKASAAYDIQYPKAFPAPPPAAAMNDSREKAALMRTHIQGSPSRRVLNKNAGPCPRLHSPYNVREETNIAAQPADHALVRSLVRLVSMQEVEKYNSRSIDD